jgi:membrane-associated phospholipid phosphatase
MFTKTLPNDEKIIHVPVTKKMWLYSLIVGSFFWVIGLILWGQQGIDKTVLFYFNDSRAAHEPIAVFSRWLSAYGMAVITTILVLYLLASSKFKQLNAPVTIYLYTICSMGLTGIAGDLLKELFARPRPVDTYFNEIVVLSQSVTPSIPSGHATKSVALILPFLFLVANSNNVHKTIKVLFTLVAGGVCVSRIVLGAHYVSDVAAGIGTAVIGLPLTMLFANMILKQSKEEQLPLLSRVWGALLIFLTIVFMLL